MTERSTTAGPTIRLKLGPGALWHASVDEAPSALASDRSLSRAERKVRAAAADLVPAFAKGVGTVHISTGDTELDGDCAKARELQAEADRLGEQSRTIATRAAARLVNELGVSNRDAAQLLARSAAWVNERANAPRTT